MYTKNKVEAREIICSISIVTCRPLSSDSLFSPWKPYYRSWGESRRQAINKHQITWKATTGKQGEKGWRKVEGSQLPANTPRKRLPSSPGD